MSSYLTIQENDMMEILQKQYYFKATTCNSKSGQNPVVCLCTSHTQDTTCFIKLSIYAEVKLPRKISASFLTIHG